MLEIHSLVGLHICTVWCDILHDGVGLIINDDRSVKLFIELHLACTNLDDIIGSSPFNVALEHGVLFIDWFNFLLTRGQINSIICWKLQPFENLLACGAPSPKESSASSADSLPRFGNMDAKPDMLASLGEDTIAFDSPVDLLS
jgi:hypothetical protein